MFMVKQQLIFDLRTFVANSTLSRLRAFGGHFWPKSGGRGHANILYDQAVRAVRAVRRAVRAVRRAVRAVRRAVRAVRRAVWAVRWAVRAVRAVRRAVQSARPAVRAVRADRKPSY